MLFRSDTGMVWNGGAARMFCVPGLCAKKEYIVALPIRFLFGTPTSLGSGRVVLIKASLSITPYARLGYGIHTPTDTYTCTHTYHLCDACGVM